MKSRITQTTLTDTSRDDYSYEVSLLDYGHGEFVYLKEFDSGSENKIRIDVYNWEALKKAIDDAIKVIEIG